MVKATRGVLVTCDPAVKQILLQLDEENRSNRRFVIADLDETHVLISPEAVERVKDDLELALEANHWNPLQAEEE
ncbi:TFIIH complex subunit TFB5 [Rhodotorula paludigena]|uniref:TFIIH complex subunit TFB5 n=1 Tax=Rhodotorula paludigena TaxID=86838 RepID=UPI00316CB2E1